MYGLFEVFGVDNRSSFAYAIRSPIWSHHFNFRFAGVNSVKLNWSTFLYRWVTHVLNNNLSIRNYYFQVIYFLKVHFKLRLIFIKKYFVLAQIFCVLAMVLYVIYQNRRFTCNPRINKHVNMNDIYIYKYLYIYFYDPVLFIRSEFLINMRTIHFLV